MTKIKMKLCDPNLKTALIKIKLKKKRVVGLQVRDIFVFTHTYGGETPYLTMCHICRHKETNRY